MEGFIPLQVSDEFKSNYFELFYELSKETFEAAKKESGAGRYMTKKQCCEFIGISFGDLQKLEKLGLSVIELEGKVLVNREDIIKFINKNKRIESLKLFMAFNKCTLWQSGVCNNSCINTTLHGEVVMVG